MTLGAELREGERARLAVTKDISRTGALLLCESRFADGQTVELVMVNRGSKEEYHLKGKVVRSKKRAQESPLRWELAFSFEEELAADSPLLQEVPDEKAEKRRHAAK